MVITKILQPNCVIAPLKGNDKESVITELVDVLSANNQLDNRDNVLEAVLMREETRSTGIGSGIAIPHGKCAGVKELVMAVGIAPVPVEFNSIDGKPVSIIVLLASPIDRTGPHIQALAKISRMMLDEEFKSKLEKSTSPEQVYELMATKDTD